jgi:hypothetical protein
MELKRRFRIPGYWLGIQFKIALKKREGTPVIGIYNKIGHHYVPFFDYDGIKDKNLLYAEIRSIQETYSLGNAYIFKTENGYHVIMTDLLHYDEWLEILSGSTCDEQYKRIPQQNGQRAWVLRVSKKKNSTIKLDNVLYNRPSRFQSAEMIGLLSKMQVPAACFLNIENSVDRRQPILWAEYEA